MKQLKKIIASLTAITSLLALGPTPAYAAAVAQNIDVTESTANVDALETATVLLTFFNEGDPLLDVKTLANTADNTVSNEGSIDTGPAEVLIDVGNVINTSTVEGTVLSDSQTLAENAVITNSSVEAYADKTALLNIDMTNVDMADVVYESGNLIGGWANSGANFAEGGNGGLGGHIETGQALFNAGTVTTVNSNNTALSVDFGGSTTAKNEEIGNSTAEVGTENFADLSITDFNMSSFVSNVVGWFSFDEAAYAQTGGNNANGGDGGANGGTILTGAVTLNALADTTANTDDTAVVGKIGGATEARNASVSETGDAHAQANSTTLVAVNNANYAVGGNWLFFKVNSGNNDANGGDGETGGNGGYIETGDIGVLIDSSIAMNDNDTSITGNFGGDATAENINVAGSYTEANANQDPNSGVIFEVDNINNVFVATQIDIEVNTSWNTANGGFNDGGNGGNVYTGDALFLTEADTRVNTSDTSIVGDFTGEVIANNTDIAGSEAYAYADSATNVFVSNDNANFGQATVMTNLLVYVNTGSNNHASDEGEETNSNGGNIETGQATVTNEVVIDVNHSTTTVTGTGGGNATASNTAVSAGSSATADASSTETTSVINENDATVETMVASGTNSGWNSAPGNVETTGGTISTGDAVNDTTLSTSVNTNNTTIAVEQGNATASNSSVNNSSTTANANSTTTTTVINTNTASIATNVDTSTETGGNRAQTGGTISTGTAVSGIKGASSTNSNTVNLVIGP